MRYMSVHVVLIRNEECLVYILPNCDAKTYSRIIHEQVGILCYKVKLMNIILYFAHLAFYNIILTYLRSKLDF